MLEKLREKLISWLARRLMPVVEPKDLISFIEGKEFSRPFINGKELTSLELSELQKECLVLDKLRIWELMNSYFIRLAQKKMYEEAESKTHILFAKTVLYTLDVQRTIKENIEKSIVLRK